mgnify:CR=1 FL=1
MEMLKRFYSEEEGMGTVEIVMIIAALMCVALLFRKRIMQFANDVMNKVFTTSPIKEVSDKV